MKEQSSNAQRPFVIMFQGEELLPGETIARDRDGKWHRTGQRVVTSATGFFGPLEEREG